MTYSDVRGAWPGEGNIDTDPLFVNPTDGDYHLSSPSPCINAGDIRFSPQEGESDIDGDPRVLLGVVDMGADEAEEGIFAEALVYSNTLREEAFKVPSSVW